MPNHIHIIWQMLNEHKKENVQRDFLKFVSQNSQNTEESKRRNSINKKYKKEEGGLMSNDLMIKGSSALININPVIDTPEKQDSSFNSDSSNEELKNVEFDRSKRPSGIVVETFTPKKGIEHNDFEQADLSAERRNANSDYMMINNEKNKAGPTSIDASVITSQCFLPLGISPCSF